MGILITHIKIQAVYLSVRWTAKDFIILRPQRTSASRGESMCPGSFQAVLVWADFLV